MRIGQRRPRYPGVHQWKPIEGTRMFYCVSCMRSFGDLYVKWRGPSDKWQYKLKSYSTGAEVLARMVPQVCGHAVKRSRR